MSFFALGPLIGLATYPLWDAWGVGPIVAEWLFAALVVVAGIATVIRMPWNRSHWGALMVGWFLVIDTVLYVIPIVVVLMREQTAAGDPWWMAGAAAADYPGSWQSAVECGHRR